MNKLKQNMSIQLEKTIAFLIGLSFTFLLILPANSQTSFDDKQRSELVDIVREILVENPSILEEAFESLQVYRTVQEQQRLALAIEENAAALESSPNEIILGNPDGRITMVEFFDYNCGFCKRAHSVNMDLIKKYPEIKLVMKEFPILSEDSMLAARVALNVSLDDNADYAIFHDAMMTNPGRATEQSALIAAELAGADMDKLQRNLQKEEDDDPAMTRIRENHDLANALGINSTPSYILGGEVLAGALPIEQFEQRVLELRANLQN